MERIVRESSSQQAGGQATGCIAGARILPQIESLRLFGNKLDGVFGVSSPAMQKQADEILGLMYGEGGVIGG